MNNNLKAQNVQRTDISRMWTTFRALVPSIDTAARTNGH
jgi:hypothetical protein